MPIYTFACKKCQEEFTDRFPMSQSEGKGVVCPKCHNRRLKRVFKESFIIGKGSKKETKPSFSPCPGCLEESCPVR